MGARSVTRLTPLGLVNDWIALQHMLGGAIPDSQSQQGYCPHHAAQLARKRQLGHNLTQWAALRQVQAPVSRAADGSNPRGELQVV